MEDLDLMKMFEQAKAMSEVLKESSDNSSDNKQQDNSEQMQQLMRIMKLFNNAKSNDSVKASVKHNNKDKTDKNKDKVIDTSALHTAELRAINDAIPYLELRHQKNLSIALKLIEMQNIIKFYNEKEVLANNTSFDNNPEWHKGILKSMRPHMPSNKKNIIDIALQLLEIKKIMNRTNGDDNNEL